MNTAAVKKPAGGDNKPVKVAEASGNILAKNTVNSGSNTGNATLPERAHKPDENVNQAAQGTQTAGSPPNPVQAGKTPTTRRIHAIAARLKPTGYVHNTFDITVDADVLFEEILNPDYWLHVAAQFKPFDKIEVLCENGTWKADLIVLGCDARWAKVFPLNHWDLTQAIKDMPKTAEEDYYVKWHPVNKYTIYKRGQEGLPPVKTNFDSQIDAWVWLDGFIKSLNK
jgi:hypothetical protein